MPHKNRREASAVHREFEVRAQEYINTRPGRASWVPNTALHNQINLFNNGELTYEKNKEILVGVLKRIKSRILQMHEADDLVEAMGITFPSCLAYSPEEDFHPTPEVDKRQGFAFNLIAQSAIIKDPFVPAFAKPVRFLSIAMAENCASEEEMTAKFEQAWKFKYDRDMMILPRVRERYVNPVTGDHEVQGQANGFIAAMKTLGHRVHLKALSMSSAHRDYQHVRSASSSQA